MKKVLFAFLSIWVYQFSFGQSQYPLVNTFDTIQHIREINSFADTLWVMDSSYSYSVIQNHQQLSCINKVLTRNEQGNKLTELSSCLNMYWGVFENSSLDSVSYYTGTNNVHIYKSFAWNNVDEIWMNSNYQLFDENLNLMEQYNKVWNNNELKYIGGNRIVNEYENNLLKTSTTYNYLPEMNLWEPKEKDIRYDNEFDKDSLLIQQKWNANLQQWVNQSKNEMMYNADTLLTDSYTYVWDSVLFTWVNGSHGCYHYLENTQPDTLVYFKWDSNETKWINYLKSFFVYNESGKITESVTEDFNAQSQNWENSSRIETIYNDLNQTRTIYQWDTTNELWIPALKDFRSFIINNITDTVQYDYWDSISQQWSFQIRFINIFDERLNQTEALSQMWDNTSEAWETNHWVLYYWSPFHPLSVNESEIAQFKVYPNPAKNIVMFSYKLPVSTNSGYIALSNTAGQTVASLQLGNAEGVASIDVRHLPSGVYFYTFTTSRTVFTGKFVVTK